MSRQINLFTPPTKKQKPSFSSTAMLQILGVVLLAVGGVTVFARIQTAVLAEQAQTSTALLETETNRLSKFTAESGPRQASKLLADEVQRLDAQLKDREKIMETLKTGAMGNTEGFSEYMRALARQSINGLWLTGFSISGAGHNLEIEGRVISPDLLPTYIQRLNQEKAFQGRTFSALQMSIPKPNLTAKPVNKNKEEGEVISLSYINFKLFTAEDKPDKPTPTGQLERTPREAFEQAALERRR